MVTRFCFLRNCLECFKKIYTGNFLIQLNLTFVLPNNYGTILEVEEMFFKQGNFGGLEGLVLL